MFVFFSAVFGSSTRTRHPPRSTRFICSLVRCLPEEAIRETRDRLPGINGVCAWREPELETADVLQLLLGMTPEKQVVCLLVLVGLDRPLGFPVQMLFRWPRVVAVRAHVIAVEQRVIVDTMALGRPIHTHTGLTVPDRVMVHDEVPAVIVEVDAPSEDYCVTTLGVQGCTSQRAKRFLPSTGVLVKPVIADIEIPRLNITRGVQEQYSKDTTQRNC